MCRFYSTILSLRMTYEKQSEGRSFDACTSGDFNREIGLLGRHAQECNHNYSHYNNVYLQSTLYILQSSEDF